MTATPLVSMEMTDEEQLDYACPIPVKDRPKFPWNLRISLTQAEMEKLGCDPAEAVVGAYVTGRFEACITSVSMSQNEGGDQFRMELQIEALAIPDDDDAAGNELPKATQSKPDKRYGRGQLRDLGVRPGRVIE